MYRMIRGVHLYRNTGDAVCGLFAPTMLNSSHSRFRINNSVLVLTEALSVVYEIPVWFNQSMYLASIQYSNVYVIIFIMFFVFCV